jgi:hypothetical protein
MINRKPQRTKRNATSEMKRSDHHQDSLFVIRDYTLTISYGHVKKRKKRGIEATSTVKYGKEGRRTCP